MFVADDIVGQPVNAVLAPPQAERFAAVAGVDLNRLILNVTGFNKRTGQGDDLPGWCQGARG